MWKKVEYCYALTQYINELRRFVKVEEVIDFIKNELELILK